MIHGIHPIQCKQCKHSIYSICAHCELCTHCTHCQHRELCILYAHANIVRTVTQVMQSTYRIHWIHCIQYKLWERYVQGTQRTHPTQMYATYKLYVWGIILFVSTSNHNVVRPDATRCNSMRLNKECQATAGNNMSLDPEDHTTKCF